MPSKSNGLEVEEVPSVKDLASSEPALRRHNLNQILAYLSSRPPIAPLNSTQCLQLWRGFSVALYMHDSKNAISVQNLIGSLAGTLTTMYEQDLALNSTDENNASSNGDGGQVEWIWLSTWARAFWETLCREWAGIDQWRMNKYLLLIRFVVRQTFRIVFSADEQTSLLESQIRVLQDLPLSPRERKVPDGLRLHVLDVWTEELENAEAGVSADADGEDEEQEEKDFSELTSKMMQLIRDLAKESISKSVKMKAKAIVKSYDEENKLEEETVT